MIVKVNGKKVFILKFGFMFLFFLVVSVLCNQLYFSGCPELFAQEKVTDVAVLKNRILKAKPSGEIYSALEDLTGRYFKDNQYNECVEYLNSLIRKRKDAEPIINYYIAFTRYSQLKYLEEARDWNEYFAKGSDYRGQILEAAQKSIDKTVLSDSANILSKLVLWRMHKDQDDSLSEPALADLISAVLEYSKGSGSSVLIKNAADQLRSYGETGKSKELYRIYVNKIITGTKSQDLEPIALGFYKEGNLELSEEVYDAYINSEVEGLSKEKLIPILINIAKQFSYESQSIKDLFFAEKVFKKIEEAGGKEAFGEELLYSRAFNLEKAKEYAPAKDLYLDLISRYPESVHVNKARYKVGVIYAYILRDLKNGKEYFENLTHSITPEVNPGLSEASSSKEAISSEKISSLYQLGLFSQWSGDFVKARDYYNKLVESSQGGFAEKVELVRERLKEIDEAKPIEYNLKTFLDISLKEEKEVFDMTRSDLRLSPYCSKKGEAVNVDLTANPGESGCMQIDLEFLWSGDLGDDKPNAKTQSFNTKYQDSGTKQINVVIVSSSGILDRNIGLTDVD